APIEADNHPSIATAQPANVGKTSVAVPTAGDSVFPAMDKIK
ncbi:hypothetical protein L917_06292, partial [Phytophthora nicotianae]